MRSARWLAGAADVALRRPGLVLSVAAALTVAAAALIPGLAVEAGHSKLLDPDDPELLRFQAFLEDFGSPDALIVLLEGGDAPTRRATLDTLAEDLRSEPTVRDLVYRIDLEALARGALLHMPLRETEALVAALEPDAVGARVLEGTHGLQSLLDGVAETLDEIPDTAPAAQEQASRATTGLARFLDLLAVRLEAPPPAGHAPLAWDLIADSDRLADLSRGFDRQGYMVSRDGDLHLMMVRLAVESDEPLALAGPVDLVSGRVQTAASAAGLTARLTGIPAMVTDEARVIGRDVLLTTGVAALAIAALFALGLRSVGLGVVGMVPLLMALIWTLAGVRLAFGSLNMITSAFAATLLGLGIDFAVHLLARFQEARRDGDERPAAIRSALLGAGPGVLTGGLTSAGAFLALGVAAGFSAFEELGLMTGAGLVGALGASLLVLPAMLAHPRLARLSPPPRPRRPSRAPAFVTAHPGKLLALGLLATVGLAAHGGSVAYETDVLALLPRDLPSTEAWRELDERTDHSVEVCVLTADDLAEVERLVTALDALPQIGRVEAITRFLPRDQPPKLALLKTLRPTVERLLAATPTPDPAHAERLAGAARDIGDALEDARFEAKQASADEAALLEAPIAASRRLAAALDASPPPERLDALQAEILDLRRRALALLDRATTGQPVTAEELLASLPPALAARLHSGGRHAVYAYPSERPGPRDVLEALVTSVRSVSETATGFPMLTWADMSAIEAGFRRASGVAIVVVILLLLLDFGRIRPAVLALAPTAVGLVWVWGAMGALGMRLNPANLIAFPLLLGIGVDTGVHIVHRHRQRPEAGVDAVLRHTGHAVLLAGSTTLVGLGSLALARHAGIASLGAVLCVGLAACLVTAVVLLPAWLARR